MARCPADGGGRETSTDGQICGRSCMLPAVCVGLARLGMQST